MIIEEQRIGLMSLKTSFLLTFWCIRLHKTPLLIQEHITFDNQQNVLHLPWSSIPFLFFSFFELIIQISKMYLRFCILIYFFDIYGLVDCTEFPRWFLFNIICRKNSHTNCSNQISQCWLDYDLTWLCALPSKIHIKFLLTVECL